MSGLVVLLGLLPAQLSAADAVESGIAHRLGGRARTHFGEVTATDYSIDGRYALSADSGGEIKVWNSLDGRAITTISGHERSVHFAFFIAPNSDIQAPTTLEGNGRGVLDPSIGRLPPIVSSSDDHTLRIWNTADGTERTRLLDADLTLSVGAISPDGKFLAAGQRLGSRILLFDLERGLLIGELADAEGMLFDLEFSPNGQRLASGYGFGGEVLVHEISTGKLLLSKSYQNRILGLGWAPDGKSLALNMYDKMVLVNATDGEILDQQETRLGPNRQLVFAPDGEAVYFANPLPTGLQRWKPGKKTDQISDPWGPQSVETIDVSPNGRQLICGSREGELQFYDLTTRQQVFAGRGHQQQVTALAFSGDSKRLISGSADRSVMLWTVRTGKLTPVESLPKNNISGVGYRGRRGSAVTAFRDRLIVWSPSGKVVWATPLQGYSDLTSFAMSLNGQKAWTGHQRGELLEWDLSGKPEFKLIAKLPALVMDIDLSADNQLLAAISQDGSLRVYSTTGGRMVFSEKIAHTSQAPNDALQNSVASAMHDLKEVEFLGSNLVVTATRSGQLQCRNPTNGQLLWEQPVNKVGTINAMAKTPNGTFVVTATKDELSFWRASDGRKQLKLPLPEENPTSLAFSPDGKLMATGMRDSSVLIWQTYRLEAGPY
jgi:WD40 repeat protein